VYSSRCDLHAPSRRRPGQSACTAGTACDAICKIPRAKDSERAGGMAQGVVARTDSTSSRARPDQTPAVTQSSVAMWPSTWCGQRRCGNGNTALKQCAGLGASCSGCHSNTTVLINSRVVGDGPCSCSVGLYKPHYVGSALTGVTGPTSGAQQQPSWACNARRTIVPFLPYTACR
jgi:hypothetical protein